MDLNEKIAARRRERESRALKTPNLQKKTAHQQSHSNTKKFSNNKIESKSSDEHPILGLISLVGFSYITYLLIFDPDFAWWEFFLWLFGIGFLMNLFTSEQKQKTSK